MQTEVTYSMLLEIYQYYNYNPLGEKYNFLVDVDDFLEWSKIKGEFYWIWGGALEWTNEKDDPKDILKELPFVKLPSDYKDLLVEAWLRFINEDKTTRESILREYELLTM